MPRVARCFLHAALVFWLAGTVLGVLLLVQKAAPFHAQLWVLLPVHYEFLLWGWLVQLALGVAYWILPGKVGTPGSAFAACFLSPKWVWGVFVLLNTSLLLFCVQQLSAFASLLPAFAQAAKLAAASGFALHVLARLALYEQQRQAQETLRSGAGAHAAPGSRGTGPRANP